MTPTITPSHTLESDGRAFSLSTALGSTDASTAPIDERCIDDFLYRSPLAFFFPLPCVGCCFGSPSCGGVGDADRDPARRFRDGSEGPVRVGAMIIGSVGCGGTGWRVTRVSIVEAAGEVSALGAAACADVAASNVTIGPTQRSLWITNVCLIGLAS
jgi:hypothetical protein